MEIFSEIYGIYYRIIGEILQAMPLKENEIRKIVSSRGMPESTLHLLPQLLEKRAWPLFEEEDGVFISKLSRMPQLPLSKLEKSWLKALLQDRRIKLFLSDEEWVTLNEKLANEEPLYGEENLFCFDCCLDGDDYDGPVYRENFRRIIEALQDKKVLKISFTSGKGSRSFGHFIPLKLEYSEKDDKFRMYCAQIRPGHGYNYTIINLARITEIADSEETYSEEFRLNHFFSRNRVKEPLVVEISGERNALERFMVEFSAYEKSSEFDEERKRCTATVYYQKYDETEILIKILSFGPTIKVISPEPFIDLIKERVQKQMSLLSADLPSN